MSPNQISEPYVLPTPTIPPRMPAVHMRDFQSYTDFPPKLPVSQLANPDQIQCGVCTGIEHHPDCNNTYCEYCIKNDFHIRAANYSKRGDSQQYTKCPLPQCRSMYHIAEFCKYSKRNDDKRSPFQLLLCCPNECDDNTSSIYVTKHQRFVCALRTIECSNVDCTVIGQENEIEKQNETCHFSAVGCNKCLIPYLHGRQNKHNCIIALMKENHALFWGRHSPYFVDLELKHQTPTTKLPLEFQSRYNGSSPNKNVTEESKTITSLAINRNSSFPNH